MTSNISTIIVKVPQQHFNRLIESCCTIHNCENNLEKCECLNSIEEEYFGYKPTELPE